MTRIEALARQQLDAYNRCDLEAFVSCYHPAVRVLRGEELTTEGLDEFRRRYEPMFAHGQFGASVPTRLALNTHCVDDELWWRIDPESGERSEGRVLVRYHERDGLIGTVQFLS